MKYPFDSLRFWLGLFLFAAYLITFSGKFHVMDELAVFTAGNNLAQHGRADIDQLIWTNHWTPHPPGIWGQDGHLYTKKAPGISFITAPLIWLGHRLPGLNAVHVGLLTNALITALTASFLFVWLTDLGFARLTATITTLGYGLCTIAWIYARMFWELSLLALCFLLAVWAVYRATRLAYARQRLFWVLLAGASIAVGLTLRFETAPAIVFLALYLIWESVAWLGPLSGPTWNIPSDHHTESTTTFQTIPLLQRLRLFLTAVPWGRLIIFATPVILMGIFLLMFNMRRYGSLSETGYTQEILFNPPWIGSFGLLFSPGQGLFIYAPFALLLFFGLRPAKRRLSPPYFWLIISTFLFYWLFYGSWFAWGGTWGWGPRFLLPTLPLLMVFVAEPIQWAYSHTISGERGPLIAKISVRTLAWLGIATLMLLSLIVNFLGIVVDFNEHFLRLGRNDNFVFNWKAFPLTAHWQILQDGLVDIIWLQHTPDGLTIVWSVLTPALILLGLATIGLGLTIKNEVINLRLETKKRGTTTATAPAKSLPPPYFIQRLSLYILLFIFLPVTLTYQMMQETAHVAQQATQARHDQPLLQQLTTEARLNDGLLIPMPPFADVQEISTWLMAYLDPALPTAAWIENEPRAIQPQERDTISHTFLAETERIWLFERWLTPDAPPNPIALQLDQMAFPLQEQWFENSGKLTLYAVADTDQTSLATPLNIPFQGGFTLVDYTLLDPTIGPDQTTLRLRLTWQAPSLEHLRQQGLSPEPIMVFAQLLQAGQNVAQHDRLLFDLPQSDHAPLQPGQTISQGYGLSLSPDLPATNYALVVGLYQANSGQRLSRADDSPDDFLYLTDVVVER